MALQFKDIFDATTLLCPMIDARRMEVFCAIYDNDLNVIAPTQAKIIDENAFSEILESQKIVFFGDGAMKCHAVLKHQPNAIVLPKTILPSAKNIGLLAQQSFENQDFEDLITFEPYYLKDFVGTVPRKNLR